MAAVVYTYLACDLRTGRIAEELPALAPSGALSRRMGGMTNASFSLALDGAPREWEAATDPARTLIVAVDSLTGLPVWSGIPLPRVGGSSNSVTLTTATPEGYLDRRYAAYSGTAVDLATAMEGVCAPLLTEAPPFVFDTTATGVTVDYTVLDEEDKSVLSCLQELDGLSEVGEWTVDTVWADAAQTRVQLMLRIKPSIGIQAVHPEATFELPGAISEYTLTESYERGKGATSVIARGEGQGADRVSSSEHVATAQIASGWCRWEHRYQPAQGITDVAQLEAHAAQALALLARGSRAWTLQAVASAAPRLGSAWGLGDSVALVVERSPRHPSGVSAVARVFGWDIDPGADRVTPILLEDE